MDFISEKSLYNRIPASYDVIIIQYHYFPIKNDIHMKLEEKADGSNQ